MSRFAGKVAIVTGGSSGIGLATAKQLAQEGAKVVIAGRTQETLDAAVAEIKANKGEAIGVIADAATDAGNKLIVDTALETYGGLHISFLNAGGIVTALLAEVTEADLLKAFSLNTNSVALGFKYQLAAIQKSGGNGAIVVNTSVAASRVSATPLFAGNGIYAASKSAADTITKYAAIEAAAHGTRVNAVAPGIVYTNIAGPGIPQEVFDGMAGPVQLIPRAGKPEEIAKFVCFLLSDDASFTTGSILGIDGGAGVKL